MTRRIRAGLCLVTVFAVCAAVAASASAALPEFTGPFPKTFTSKSKASVLETVGKTKVKCTADTNAGEITGPKSDLVTVRFTGCVALKFQCGTPGAAPGEIVTGVLTSMLGYINIEKKEVGIDLSNPAGALITEFFCGGNLRVVVRGSVIGRVTPVNKIVKPPQHFTLKLGQAKGKQKITKFQGEPVDVLESSVNGGPFEESGLNSTDELTLSEPAVIIA